MKYQPPYKFEAMLIKDDARTCYKMGKTFKPKGVYWHKNNVILVGSVINDHVVRLSFPAEIIQVEITKVNHEK